MPEPSRRCFALVPCAGVGERAQAGGPKQYAVLAGRSVVAHTLAALSAVRALEAVLVVLAPDDQMFERHAPAFDGARAWVARCGGGTRAESVANGLAELRRRGASDADWVLVHDAARCLLRPAWVEALIAACRDDDVGGLLALPLADTLKQQATGGGGSERVAATVPREGKWLAQTPQMFRLGLLQRALAAAGTGVSDESSAVEALGLAPRLVRGDLENLKLTWPADFALAARLLETRP
jgi:2-C-methyl-D-erythritol 4-phosphate cytidylyltransferase